MAGKAGRAGLGRLRSLVGRGGAAPEEAPAGQEAGAGPAGDVARAPPAAPGREGPGPTDVAVREILGGDERNAEFEEFLDERILVSRDALGKKEMKIKVVEVTDEHPPSKWKLGDRVKARRILVTIKHLETMRVEEAEFDIEAIERELAEKRHYTSSNRWIPTSEIRNGYVLKSRHMPLISDAVALDYITF
ncbi:MAG: hypothetical protein OXU25_04110 [Thaumarchaeota archaeon]|nr:hypothetical protein [Nitrososphaerota archaeon]